MNLPCILFCLRDVPLLTLFDMGFYEPSVIGGAWGPRPHHNFVVFAPMIITFGTGVKLDLFYTSLLLRDYDVITYILADAWA